MLLSWAVPERSQPEPEGQAPRGPYRGPSPRLRRLRGHHPQGRVRRRHRHALGRGHLGAGRRSRGGASEGRLQVHPSRRAAQGEVGARPHAQEARRALEARELAAHQGARRIRDRRVEADRRARDQQRPHRPDHGRDRRRQCRVAQVRREHQEGRSGKGAGRKRPAGRRRKGSPPKFIEPQLATLVDAPPEGDEWVHEIKYDGYRVLAAVGGGEVRVYTRRGPRLDRQVPAPRPAAPRPAAVVGADRRRGGGRRQGRPDRFRRASGPDRRGEGQGHRLLHVRPALPRRRGPPQEAARSSGRRSSPRSSPTSREPARSFYSDHVVGSGAAMLRARLRDQPRRHRLQARGRALPFRPHQGLAQVEMRLRPGVRHHRLAAVGG